MLSPPHTFSSVVRDLRIGLKNRTAVLRAEVPVQPTTELRVRAREGTGEGGGVRLLERMFLLTIPKRSREHLIGDLEEEYRTIVLPEYGRFRARLWYWRQMLWIAGPFIWNKLKRALALEPERRLHKR